MMGLKAEMVRTYRPGSTTVNVPAATWKRFEEALNRVMGTMENGEVETPASWEKQKLDALSAAVQVHVSALVVE